MSPRRPTPTPKPKSPSQAPQTSPVASGPAEAIPPRSKQEGPEERSTGSSNASNNGGEAIRLGGTPLVRPKPKDAPHVLVEAYAGTGKTFTEIVGVGWAFAPSLWTQIQAEITRRAGLPEGTPIVPSPEQQAVWDALRQSSGIKTIAYCAFNVSIVKEFSTKWGWLVELLKTVGVNLQFATVNGLGNRSVYATYGRCQVVDWHTETLLGRLLGRDTRDLKRQDAVFVKACCELVALCKLTLAGWSERNGFDSEAVTDEVLDEISAHYDLEFNGSRERVYRAVPQLLGASQDVAATHEIDFNDQNWLPVVNDLPVLRLDLVLADEVQDLPRAKQEFLRKLGRRLVMVGDTYQAIYGFCGADTESMGRLRTLLSPTADRPIEPLRLTETRRCGRAIVAEAQRDVPDFRAHESNPSGRVGRIEAAKYMTQVQDGDMILCRVNAPLISHALRFIKAGRKAVVRGRDFGKQLLDFVAKMRALTVPGLVSATGEWLERECAKENAKKNPSEARLLTLQDRHDCILAFCEGATDLAAVEEKMQHVFAGKQCPQCQKHFNESSEECFSCKCRLIQPKGVVFSSIHRAKGLESRRVFILRPDLLPHPSAKSPWQQQQERNCRYIAVTRAIEELTYVIEPPKE